MSTKSAPIPFEFTGTGGDYFRIWIVNLLLSALTLGAYSAWAKVRRLKYFYNNTSLDGAVFDYHADPKAILRGRLIAVPVLVVIAVLDKYMKGAAYPLAYLALAPWVVVSALCFNAANTSYSGLRFGFSGSKREAYRIMSLEIFYVIFTLGLLYPLWRYRFKRYVFSNLRYGDKSFHFGTPLAPFVWVYGDAVLVLVLAALAGGLVFRVSGLAAWMPFAAVLIWLGCGMYLTVGQRKLIFNHLGLGPEPVSAELGQEAHHQMADGTRLHRFMSTLALGSYARVWVPNVILTLLTFGFFAPFAAVRNMAMLAGSTLLVKSTTQEAATAVASGSRSSLGSEASDTGSIDFGL